MYYHKNNIFLLHDNQNKTKNKSKLKKTTEIIEIHQFIFKHRKKTQKK